MKKTFLFILIICLFLSGCSQAPPKHPNNICQIFREYPSWYWATQRVAKRYHIPISVQMAFIYTESSFRANAKPPHQKLLGIIPWFRPTSADGYTQATNQTWRWFVKANHLRSANRTDFATAAKFIGWYGRILHRRLGISSQHANALYLAYHEGIEGYQSETYLNKPWLIRLATHVQLRVLRYQRQLWHCQHQLPKKPWWRFWQ